MTETDREMMDPVSCLLTVAVLCLGLTLGRRSARVPRERVPVFLGVGGHAYSGGGSSLVGLPESPRDLVIDSIETPLFDSRRSAQTAYLVSLAVNDRLVADYTGMPAAFPNNLGAGVPWPAGTKIELWCQAHPHAAMLNGPILVRCHYFED